MTICHLQILADHIAALRSEAELCTRAGYVDTARVMRQFADEDDAWIAGELRAATVLNGLGYLLGGGSGGRTDGR